MKFQLERIALFSDAVFAIAITLMMIEVKPPHLEHGISFTMALGKFLSLMPIFVGVILSFFMIGVFWKTHHELMKYMAAYDSKVIALNTSLLLSIAFIPFSTAFVFENIASHSPFPMVVYNLNYIIASFLNYRLFTHILDPKNNLRSEAFRDDLATVKRERLFPIVVYVFVILFAFVSPEWAGLGYGLFALENLFIKKKRTEAAAAPVQEEALPVAEAEKQ